MRAATAVSIHRCGYVTKCKARSCLKRATVVADKSTAPAATPARSTPVLRTRDNSPSGF